ncbi:MAG: ABC transporter permease subunit [Candidatus Nitrohelix vancouverensis]|uniref:ABC transporter permease subunit n=1 Tax=Candidatus Nitrohelix vancouverensis TaxID=2705534 RepID=A0A7T0C278_9BACT|nr:MAG: ABC transporter permease subunit [Candidatus Nitrohelix vancouverensis]
MSKTPSSDSSAEATAQASRPASSIFDTTLSKAKLKRRLADKIASGVVTLGGTIIIFSILAILLVIVIEALPLFQDPTVELKEKKAGAVQEPTYGLGVDEYQKVAYVIGSEGIQFFNLPDWHPADAIPLNQLQGATITGAAHSPNGAAALGLSNGSVLPVTMAFDVVYGEDQKTVQPRLDEGDALVMSETGQPITVVGFSKREAQTTIAAGTGGNEISTAQIKVKRSLMGGVKRKVKQAHWNLPVQGEITALAVDVSGNSVLVGTSSGQILKVNINSEDPKNAIFVVGATANSGVGVSFLNFLNGGYTLIVGDTEGRIKSYHLDKDHPAGKLKHIYEFDKNQSPPRAMTISLRDKGFFTASEDGSIEYRYGTTGETQFSIDGSKGVYFTQLALSPKNNALLALDTKGDFYHWDVDNPHPSISLKGLFGKIWYEGHDEPKYIWQSTGGSDDFESKYSLMPLIFGTMKGTFYAMVFALPLALLAAFYSSQFMHPRLNEITKPAVELMATLPTVALGFVGALIVAPLLEKYFVGFVLFPLLAMLFAFLGWWSERRWKLGQRCGLKPGMEMILLFPLVLLGAVGSIYIGGQMEQGLMDGDFRYWLLELFQINYDQRNALVVGIAMGFAIVPLIFTIAEDSLSNVPFHLRAGSLALGATPWQTAVKVILPVALPGIFSAVMIGFGRAVGETMIVLMATGNTPIMDWSVFNGFRAMSANIAVELPEAPEGGSLYRVLFLMAFLLFIITFATNTVAELVRLKLRQKFKAL